MADPPLLTVGVVRGAVPPLLTVGALRGTVPPFPTVGALRGTVPPLLTVGVLRGAVPPLLTVGALRVTVPPLLMVPVGGLVVPPPPPGFLTLTEGRATGVPVGRVGLGGVAEDPVPLGLRSRTGLWVVPDCEPEPPRVDGATAVPVVSVRRLFIPSTPGRGCPVTAGGVPLVLPGLKADGAPVRGTARRFPFPSTPGWSTSGVLRTTTCGIPGSPTALSLNPKWATPRRGWT